MSKVKEQKVELKVELPFAIKELLSIFDAESVIKEIKKQNRTKSKSGLIQGKSLVKNSNDFFSIYGEVIAPDCRKELIKFVKDSHKQKNPSVIDLIKSGNFSLQKRKSSCGGRCSKCINGLWCSTATVLRIQIGQKVNIYIPKTFDVKVISPSLVYT